MAKETTSHHKDLSKDPEFVRFVMEYGKEGIRAGGAIPSGHKGSYKPTLDQLQEAVQAVADADLKTSSERMAVMKKNVSRLFRKEGRK